MAHSLARVRMQVFPKAIGLTAKHYCDVNGTYCVNTRLVGEGNGLRENIHSPISALPLTTEKS